MARISNGQYWAVKNTLTKVEKELVNFYELQWHLRHHIPTAQEVASHLKIDYSSVRYYLKRPPVQTALKKRGVKWEQTSQEDLTPEQVATAIVMSNFADTRPNDVKLDQLGVNPSEYYAWLNDPQFKNMVENLADQNIKNIKPTAIGELTKKINQGDWNAVKYYLDVTGALNNDAPQSEQLIKMLVEIIQRHIKDPEIISAIAQDFKLASANRTLEVIAHPQITGEYIEDDPELEDAKKKLGIM